MVAFACSRCRNADPLSDKPATLGAAHAKESSAPKKSLDATPKLNETTEAGPVEAGPARAGSSSSSSSDEEKKAKKAAKNKSRSVSRKRASIFGGLLGKKDKAEEKVEEKKEEHEAKKEVEATPAAPAPNGMLRSVSPTKSLVIDNH